MTTASVTTDINFGPYKIPSNAQNMIMNNYADRFKLKVEIVIPEPIMSNQLGTTQWLNKEFNFENIILCSIHQLPDSQKYLSKIIQNLGTANFNFAIEGLKGKGENFLKNCSKEAKYFNNAESIDTKNTNWIELYNKLKKDS